MNKSTIILIIIGILSPFSAYCLEIKINSTAEVSDSVVKLGDIAEISEESALGRSLSSRNICRSPEITKNVILSADEIRDALGHSLNIDVLDEDITWLGSPSTTISRKSITINSADMERSISDYLLDKMEENVLPEADYTFIPRQLPLPFALPAGDIEVTVTPSNPEILGSSRFSFVYKVDGNIIKNLSIRGTLRAMAPVVVLTRNVRRGTILASELVEVQERDIAELREPCTDLNMAIGKKLKRSQRAGNVLDNNSLEFPPIIRKGQLVQMVVHNNGLQLTATGIASMDGKQDQIIRVKNTKSEKNVYCKVVSDGIVAVQI